MVFHSSFCNLIKQGDYESSSLGSINEIPLHNTRRSCFRAAAMLDQSSRSLSLPSSYRSAALSRLAPALVLTNINLATMRRSHDRAKAVAVAETCRVSHWVQSQRIVPPRPVAAAAAMRLIIIITLASAVRPTSKVMARAGLAFPHTHTDRWRITQSERATAQWVIV